MVAVPADERAQVLLVPVREDEVEVERRLLPHPDVEGLVHDQEAHPVGQLEQLRRGRIVARADGVAAHLPQHLQLALGRARVERRAERAEVVVVVDALELDALAVDEDAPVGIEPQRRGCRSGVS